MLGVKDTAATTKPIVSGVLSFVFNTGNANQTEYFLKPVSPDLTLLCCITRSTPSLICHLHV